MYFKVAKTADGAACAIEFEGIHVLRIVEGAERNEQFAQDVADALNELFEYTKSLSATTEPYVTGAITSIMEKTNQLKSAITTFPERGSMSTKPTTTKQPKGKAKPKQKTKEGCKQTVPPVNVDCSPAQACKAYDKLLADFKRLTPAQKSNVLAKLTRGMA